LGGISFEISSFEDRHNLQLLNYTNISLKDNKMKYFFKYRIFAISFSLIILISIQGCTEKNEKIIDPVAEEVNKKIFDKYGKSLLDLPSVKLVIISPHDTAIQKEFERAFRFYYAIKYGQNVDIEWRSLGGGSTAILRYLRNVYENSDSSDMDVVWGGGEYNFQKMVDEDIIQPMKIPKEVLNNIPEDLGGLEMYDKGKRWCGSAVSGFGFLYNAQLLKRLNIEFPEKWEDLGDEKFFALVGLADPMQSGTAAASFNMIVQSAGNWKDGWAKLLNILGNTKRFYMGAGDAVEALPSGEVAVSTCIDFYGITRVIKYSGTLKFVNPRGQTIFNPDPIAILKNPPSSELAQRFVDFVLSIKGQALWALPVGHPDGPLNTTLARQPIRKDVYEHYAGKLNPQIVNPYTTGQSMKMDSELWFICNGILRQLVWTAAVENLSGLKKAKEKLIETNFEKERLELFNSLPDNIKTTENMASTLKKLEDKKQNDIIVTEWIEFFRDKYRRISD
jgi:iron(III) transport system substrate-binding protein